MKIVLLSGSLPPDTCGVGDYTFNLADALMQKGINVSTFSMKDFKAKNYFSRIHEINKIAADFIHIQYPSVGYGYTTFPQFLNFFIPSIITLHEISQAQTLRKLSLFPYSIRSQKVIFTNVHELNYFINIAPWIKNKIDIIPIGSNINPNLVKQKELKDRNNEIIYFGIFRQNKGIEKLINLARLIKKRRLNFVVHLVGKPHPNQNEYYENLKYETVGLPVKWSIGLNQREVGEIMNSSLVSYLPYPDGASDRRGSLLASLQNGLPVITTLGNQTPDNIKKVVMCSKDASTTLNIINKITQDSRRYHEKVKQGVEAMRYYQWDVIADKHINLYNKILVHKNDR